MTAIAACGAPWRRETERERRNTRPGTMRCMDETSELFIAKGSGGNLNLKYRPEVSTTTTGWSASCKCGSSAGVRPCVVLDPFAGSFTSPFVAASMGRVGIGVELSADYVAQARYGRLAQDWLSLAPEAPQGPAAPARAAERQVGLFESEVAG